MVQMYIDNSGQWVYIFDIIDVFNREIVELQTRIRKLDISHERIMVNTPEENAHIESFHGTLKRGEVYHKNILNNLVLGIKFTA
jgi:putative transposase